MAEEQMQYVLVQNYKTSDYTSKENHPAFYFYMADKIVGKKTQAQQK